MKKNTTQKHNNFPVILAKLLLPIAVGRRSWGGFFFLFFGLANAQNIKVEGMVTDSLGVVIEMANVMAINTDENKMDGYSITGEKGQYTLNLKPNTNYQLKVSYLGLNPKTIDLKTGTENVFLPIIMEGSGVLIEGVEIVHEMPVSIKGDTIVYNADSFTSGTERKLGDVLKKLPGVEVDEDGGIKVEGKEVTKLMVEGKDFFDGDTKLGVQNIPADAVDKVQVLRNYSEIDQLRSVTDNQDNLAMNIKLKDGKKNFWFGDVTMGAGPDERYIINPKVFYYSEKYSLNLITNFNNTGEQPLSFSDYLKFSGGLRNMMRRGGSSFQVSNNDLGISLIRNNRAKEINTKFGAANFSYNPTKAWTLSGFAILSGTKTGIQSRSRNSILNTDNGEVVTTQESDNLSQLRSEMGLVKLSSNYKPNTKVTFEYDVFLKKSQQTEDNDIITTVTPNTEQSQSVAAYKKQDPVSVNQNASLFYAPNDKHVFAFEGQHLYQDEDPFYNANLANQPFDLEGYIGSQLRQNIHQERFLKTNKVDLKADYYYAVNNKGNLNVTLGNTYSYQNFNSHIFQVLDNNTRNDLTSEESNNRVTYAFNDIFIGLHYRFIKGKFTFNPGVSLHYYSMKDSQLESENNRTFTRILPDLDVRYQIKRSESLSYRFAFTNNFTDILNLAEGYIFQGYSSLYAGNRHLENATSQTHNLIYTKFNMFNMEHYGGFVNYSRTIDGINRISSFDGINQTSTSFNSNFANETLSGNAYYGRSFARYYKAGARVSLSWDKRNVIQVNPLNNQESDNWTESFSQNYSVSFGTTFEKLPNLELGYSIRISDYMNEVFYTSSPSVKIDYYFLNGFSFNTDYTFNSYTNKSNTVDNKFDFWNASLAYNKKDSKWEYRVGVTNLLNTRSLNEDSFSQFNIYTSQYFVQPRYVIFSLKYNL